MNKVLIGTLAVLIIGALGFMLFVGEDEKLSTSEGEQEIQNTVPANGENRNVNNTNEITTNALVLADNNTGGTVTVDYARLEKPGFIALYRMNSQSDVAFIGSSKLLMPGEYSDLDIQVDTILAKEQVVTGVLYADGGDGEFNYPEGDYYLENNYEIITDIDIIEVDNEDEDEELLEQANTYLEANGSVEADS